MNKPLLHNSTVGEKSLFQQRALPGMAQCPACQGTGEGERLSLCCEAGDVYGGECGDTGRCSRCWEMAVFENDCFECEGRGAVQVGA